MKMYEDYILSDYYEIKREEQRKLFNEESKKQVRK
jgi:hypothetical protein